MTGNFVERSFCVLRGLIVLCALTLGWADRASAQSGAGQCVGLEHFAQLAATANHLFADLDNNFSAQALDDIVKLTEMVERDTLERRLIARFRGLDYNQIKATLADLRHGATAAQLFGRSDLRRFSQRKNMVRRVTSMKDTITDLCGQSGSKGKPERAATNDNTMASLITRAVTKAKPAKSKTADQSTSNLILVYVALGGILAVVVIVPFMTARLYTMLLRRAQCRIPAKLMIGSTELTGHIVRLSMRGMNLALAPQCIAPLGLIAKQGAIVTVIVDHTKLRARLSYMPTDDIPTIGLRLLSDLDAKQHYEILALSTVRPTRAPRHRPQPATG